jgi:hydrogenase expression/formation protein HypC
MCLGVPGQITDIFEKQGLRMGKIDFGGALRETCLEYVPEAKVDDYVIVHVGFALSILSEKEAKETLDLLNEILSFEEESRVEAKTS